MMVIDESAGDHDLCREPFCSRGGEQGRRVAPAKAAAPPEGLGGKGRRQNQGLLPAHRHGRTRSGVTLIELMCVMLILSILVAMNLSVISRVFSHVKKFLDGP